MDALEKIKTFARELAAKLNTETFKEVKTKDNKYILSYDGETPMAGMPISIMDEAGQRLPAPTADYILEDGSTLKIQDGVVMEVIAGQAEPAEQGAEAKVENAEANPNAPQATNPAPAPKAVVESIVKEYRFQEQIEELKASLSEKDKAIADLTEKFNKATEATTKNESTIKDMFALVKQIAELPASESKVENKDKFKKDKPQTDLEKIVGDLSNIAFPK